MFQYIPTGIKFKIFVKETDAEDAFEKTDVSKTYLPVSFLTGNKAKEFYEDILKESSLLSEEKSLTKSKSPAKVPSNLVNSKKFKNTDLLWMAQNNDVKNLKIFFDQKKDYDVNVRDEFGWTPLMCASCSGAEEAVVILLENGADLHKCDKLGNTALKLAQHKNRKKVVEILENCKSEPETTAYKLKLEESTEKFFCPTCNVNFTSNKIKHEYSTLHLFNSRLTTSTFYGIPESNKGFQLLLREGWNKEKGLGPDGSGRKFPIKAVMKKDRAGIGAPPQPSKNKSEIPHSKRYENKKNSIYKKWREKDFEKRIRSEFS